MNTYQNYDPTQLKVMSVESNNHLNIFFSALFVSATFIVPTLVAIHFLFF